MIVVQLHEHIAFCMDLSDIYNCILLVTELY